MAGSDLAADGDQNIAGAIAATDAAGNVGTVTATKGYSVELDSTPTITVDESKLKVLNVLTDETELRSEPFVSTTTDFSQALSFDYGSDGSGTVSYQLRLEGRITTNLTATETGEPISLVLMADGKLVGQTSNGSTAFELSVDQAGKVTLIHHMAVAHPDATRVDELISLDGLGIKLVVTATDADNNMSAADTGRAEIDLGAHLIFEDDGVILHQGAAEYQVTVQSIPDVLNGKFILSSNTARDDRSLKYEGFTVTAQGFTSKYNSALTDADVYRNSSGMGVMSDESPYHNLAGEVDYRVFADSTSASEELIFKLDPGSLAFGLTAEFNLMFGGELEQGMAVFFRNDKEVGRQEFSSDRASGNYAEDFEAIPGGFDEVRFMATSNGGANPNDNSDFAIKSITFTGGVTDYLIAAAEGQVSAQAADGARFELTGLVNNFGYAIALSDGNHTLIARDTNGAKVFEIRLSESAGTWDFLQYQVVPEDIQFMVQATDGDGDSSSTTVSLDVYSGVEPTVTVDIEATPVHDTLIVDDIADLGVGRSGSGNVNDPRPPADARVVNFGYGSEHAGQVVTVSWNQQAFGGWEDGSSGATRDLFTVFANDQQIYQTSYSMGTPGGRNNDYRSEVSDHSFQIMLDQYGNASVVFEVRSTHKEETVSITNIKAELPTSEMEYPLTLAGAIESGEITSYLVAVEGGKLLHNGNVLTANAQDQYELTPGQLSGLTVAPSGDASEIKVSAVAVSNLGVESPVAFDDVDVVLVEPEPVNPVPMVSLDIYEVPAVTQQAGNINDLGRGHRFSLFGNNPQDRSDTLTFDFDAENAGKSVTLSWEQSAKGGWGPGGWLTPGDSLMLIVNGIVYSLDYSYSDYSVGVILDGQGRANIQFASYTTEKNESIDITDIKAVLPPAYSVELSGSIEEEGEIASYVVSVTDGTLLLNGQAVEANERGQSVLKPDQLHGLTVVPNDDLSKMQVTAVAISTAGERSAPVTASLDIESDEVTSQTLSISALTLDEGQESQVSSEQSTEIDVQENDGRVVAPDESYAQESETDVSSTQAKDQSQLALGIDTDHGDSTNIEPEQTVEAEEDTTGKVEDGATAVALKDLDGNNPLIGELGTDTIALELADQGTAGSPEADSVADFNATEGDTIDLSDLLQEYDSGKEDLSSFIQATEDNGSTTLHVSTDGKMSDNSHANADQTIILDGVTMGGQSSEAFIQSMISSSQLDIDK
ncbi:DUF5801 repeats-in-toxin domain-containing protein [Halomonas sp. BBD45]|uniref:DUF5801 repeats-in-toxin domain-containing protein n=1 Tax=Halomonas sp. BBD45 TaxID=1904451 RepID=UPI00209E846E|nr:DUF5801 domain-containing protein [Halomonas sp. BBD45]